MLKLEENPPMCSPSVKTIAELQGDWFVAHTKARFEKVLAFDLVAKNIGFYLPMAQRISISGGRKRRGLVPLFTSYVFFCGDAEDRYQVLTTNRVCQVISIREQAQFVAELRAVEQALARNAMLEMYPFAAVGKRCRVKAGPFEGTEGVVIYRDKRALIVMQISTLGCGASFEIDADLLEAAE